MAANPHVRRADRLRALFPSGVEAFERAGPGTLAELHASEAACCAGFAPKRIGEFVAGRTCARAALAALGIPDVSLAIRTDRRPEWPEGIVGSISHTAGYGAAVAGRIEAFRSLGLDVETVGRVSDDLFDHVFVSSERATLAALRPDRRERAASIAFSAKEAFYKCQFALTRAWVDFSEVAVDVEHATLDADVGTFVLRVASDGCAAHEHLPLAGRYRFDGGIVAAAVALVR